jgi:hypothetical protein
VTGAERVAQVKTEWCLFCWADPGKACDAPSGKHFARYLRAYRRYVISRDAMIAVCLVIPRISYGQVVPDAAVPGSKNPARAGPAA